MYRRVRKSNHVHHCVTISCPKSFLLLAFWKTKPQSLVHALLQYFTGINFQFKLILYYIYFLFFLARELKHRKHETVFLIKNTNSLWYFHKYNSLVQCSTIINRPTHIFSYQPGSKLVPLPAFVQFWKKKKKKIPLSIFFWFLFPFVTSVQQLPWGYSFIHRMTDQCCLSWTEPQLCKLYTFLCGTQQISFSIIIQYINALILYNRPTQMSTWQKRYLRKHDCPKLFAQF